MKNTTNEPEADLMVFCGGRLYAQKFTGYAPIVYGSALCLIIFGFVLLNSALGALPLLLILAGGGILFYGLYRSSTLPKITWHLQRKNGSFQLVYARNGISETATYPFPYRFGYRKETIKRGISRYYLYFTFQRSETEPEITFIKEASPLEAFPSDWPVQGEMADAANIYINSNGINLNKFEIQKIDALMRQLAARFKPLLPELSKESPAN
jgi:hypothetical protein